MQNDELYLLEKKKHTQKKEIPIFSCATTILIQGTQFILYKCICKHTSVRLCEHILSLTISIFFHSLKSLIMKFKFAKINHHWQTYLATTSVDYDPRIQPTDFLLCQLWAKALLFHFWGHQYVTGLLYYKDYCICYAVQSNTKHMVKLYFFYFWIKPQLIFRQLVWFRAYIDPCQMIFMIHRTLCLIPLIYWFCSYTTKMC